VDRSEEPTSATTGRIDHGFTHVALQVSDLDASLRFYERYAGLRPVHRRTGSDGVRVAWITDHTRPFVVVLLEHDVTHPLGGWAHLGVGVDDRSVVDERLADAAGAGLRTFGPVDAGPPGGGVHGQRLGRNRRSRREFVTTNTLEAAIAAAASMGLSRPSAATGMAATL
jgi:catechol 2,3-dioxygenase-like lactoylglutathione lyase family enzyme